MNKQTQSFTEAFSLKGKKAYVTGGGQGIGACVAHAFAQSGADVAIVDMDTEKAHAVATSLLEYDVQSIAVTADVTNEENITNIPEEIVRHLGRIDIAFNNAGICMHAPSEDMNLEMWNKVIQVNFTGVFLTS